MADSMVIFDGDVFGPLRAPDEGDAPLVVDADGMTVLVVALQGVESVGWREAECLEVRRGGEFAEFAQGPVLNVCWKFA
jgi:hypothetical protein